MGDHPASDRVGQKKSAQPRRWLGAYAFVLRSAPGGMPALVAKPSARRGALPMVTGFDHCHSTYANIAQFQ